MALLLAALHSMQAALSAASLYKSYIAITELHQYEKTSEKAAKYSGHAEHQLHKTRTTQASGAFVIALSFLTASTLAFVQVGSTALIFNLLNIGTTYLARIHIKNFWESKSKVPLVNGFNQGIEHSNAIKERLGYATIIWLFTTIVSVYLQYANKGVVG